MSIDSFLQFCNSSASFLKKINKFLSLAGMLVFMIMVALTFADVILRYFFNNPLSATFEITGLLMVLVVFSSIAYVQSCKNHVVMDVFTGTLSENNKILLESATTLWSVAVCLLSMYTAARFSLQTKSITPQLGFSIKPCVWFVVFGFGMLSVTLAVDWLSLLARTALQGKGRIFLALVLGIVPVILCTWLAFNKIPQLNSVAVGCLGIIFLFILFLAGMPVAFSLMAAGFTFSCLIRGLSPALGFYGKLMFNTSSNYAWSPLMFFMLMGYFCFYGDLGRGLYRCARHWLGHLRGGLAQGSVYACAAFGAVVGDTLSGSIAMSAIALPEMRDSGYEDKLAVGTLACSGVIGVLIPPSTEFIMYAVLAEQSVAELFMAGVIPGIICTLLFCAAIWIKVYFNPSLAPRLPKEPLSARISSLVSALPIIVLFVLVIGGIYGGVFTATEGGSIGAIGSLVCGLVLHNFTFQKFYEALNEAAKFIAMSFTILTGAAVFGYFMALSRIPALLAGSIASAGISSGITMLAIVCILFILGCFVPSMPLMLVCVPTFLPIAKMFQWDLVWFGVMLVILLNQATITPPFGINLFVIKEVAGIPLRKMFAASVPFIIGMGICALIVYFIPGTATWLPSFLR